ncbi:MAG TPA: hypothetical protein VM925_17625 [Labilithrix sp.]|nr:hypothetical protein [Labilithrix sp.]
MRGSSTVLFCAVALASIASAGTAHAQATSEQMLAQSLFDEARQLMDRGRFGEACPKLAESQRLDPGAGTLLNLAICHEKEGKTGSAYLEMTAASSQASKDGRKDREKIANDHLAALAPRVSKLSVHVRQDEPGVEVRVDGTVIRRPAWDVASVVDPGQHVVDATAPGRRAFHQVVTVAEGEQRTVQIGPFEPLAKDLGSPATTSADALPSIPPRRATNPWFVASIATAVAGFTVALPAGYVWGMLKLTEPTCKVVDAYESGSVFCTSPSVRDAWLAATLVGVSFGVVGTLGIAILPRKVEVVPAASSANAGGMTVVGRF